MPILDDATRESLDVRRKRSHEIREKFKDRHYVSQQCRLCGWSSNGLTLDEAIQEKRKHEATHPELSEFEASLLSPSELIASLHDHECKMAHCVCKCGCNEGPFCTLIFGPLCGVCLIRWGRGDTDHGLPI